MIYLDNAATTSIDPQVLEAMMPFLTDIYGNPGSLHKYGRIAKAAVDNAREQVAEFVGAKSPEHIIFTSGGTEGNNLVFAGVIPYIKDIGKNTIITSAIEHDSVLKAAKEFCYQNDSRFITIAPYSNGSIDADRIGSVIGKLYNKCKLDEVGLISVMSVNNETGVRNHVSDICQFAHDHRILFHTDAVQAAGLYPINAAENAYDMVTISSHKIHGPKGVGALYISDPSIITPLIHGGSTQEFGLRGGTENVAGIVGFGKACELSQENIDTRYNTLRSLNYEFLNTLINEVGGSDNVSINGTPSLTFFKTINLMFSGVDSQTLLLMLDSQGIAVSAGSACTAHEDTPSHVLIAMGLSPEEARSSIRVSFSHNNTKDEVKRAASIIASCVKVLRNG